MNPLAGPPAMGGVPFEPHGEVRVALVGAGDRQGGLLGCLLWIEGARVVAIADPDLRRAERLADRVTEAGKPRPDAFSAPEDVLARDDVDLLVIGTPWNTHAPLAVAAMEAGKHAAVEVPAAVTLQQCWDLVEASERTRRHCVILENCCYGQSELVVLRLAREGAFGTLLHAEAAYLHDLRAELFAKDWRRGAHSDRDGNLYPTHGLGPVAGYLGLNRGDRMTSLVSMSSGAHGLQEWRDEHLGGDSRYADEEYVCGDVNSSLIRTALGRTVLLQHHVTGPRPYSRLNELVGTRGAFTDYPPRIYLERDALGRPPKVINPDERLEQFESLDAYLEPFSHELWRRHSGDEGFAGHGGMDYLMLVRLIGAMREGRAPDMDVYDAATWSAAGPLSVASVAQGGAPVEYPDFTRGHWTSGYPGIPT